MQRRGHDARLGRRYRLRQLPHGQHRLSQWVLYATRRGRQLPLYQLYHARDRKSDSLATHSHALQGLPLALAATTVASASAAAALAAATFAATLAADVVALAASVAAPHGHLPYNSRHNM